MPRFITERICSVMKWLEEKSPSHAGPPGSLGGAWNEWMIVPCSGGREIQQDLEVGCRVLFKDLKGFLGL